MDSNPYPVKHPPPPRLLVHPFRLYDFFLFKIIFDDCILLGKRIMDEIPKIFVLWKKITVTESNKAGREGGLSKCLIPNKRGIAGSTTALLTISNCMYNTCFRPPAGLEHPLGALELRGMCTQGAPNPLLALSYEYCKWTIHTLSCLW